NYHSRSSRKNQAAEKKTSTQRGGRQRVEKVFSPRCADFETFKKVSKSCLIERAVGCLPPAHTPRCSVAQVFNEALCQSDVHPKGWTLWSGIRESNPPMQLGKLPFYR